MRRLRAAVPRAELEAGLPASSGFGRARRTCADVLDYLAEESRLLLKRGDTWYWMADAYPAQDVTLAGNDPDNVLVLDVETKKAIGEIDREASITTVHEGAIYQVEGETWKVERFDYENRRAYARRVDSDYFTEAETDTDVRVLRLERRAARAPAAPADLWRGRRGRTLGRGFGRGEVHVTTLATQYKKVRFYTRESVGAEDIHLPPEELDTAGLRARRSPRRPPRRSGSRAATAAPRGAASGRLMRRVAPLFLRCQPTDLGLSTAGRARRTSAVRRSSSTTACRAGSGWREMLFDAHREVLAAALDVVRALRVRRTAVRRASARRARSGAARQGDGARACSSTSSPRRRAAAVRGRGGRAAEGAA